ncbi:GGDEF domain-containing protein [Myxococcota bacterium]|nr:GGDEF domain-containing protein [Myxococcota bacterium]
MAIFERNRGRRERRSTPPPRGGTPPPMDGEGPLDTLAFALRAWGQTTFDTLEADAQALQARCAAWAEHALTGHPADPAQPNAAAAALPLSARRWGPMRAFIERLRQLERRTFLTQRKVLSQTLSELKELLTLENNTDQRLLDLLEEIESATKTGHLQRVEITLKTAVSEIKSRHTLMTRKLNSMSTQINHLQKDLKQSQIEASHDPLTRLFNRGVFDAAISRVREATVPNHSAVLMLIDLDHFKRVNDTYGHPAGDEVLKRVADTLVRTFPRKNDLVARYGGEEFVVLLQGINAASAGILIARLLRNVRALEIPHEREILRVTCSVGFAELKPTETTEAWIARVDAALYRAKSEGRDRGVVG